MNAFVLESRTPHYRDKFVRDRLPPNSSFQQFRRNLLLFEEKHADFVVEIGDRGDQIIVSLVDDRLVLIGNVRDFVNRSLIVAVGINDGLLINYVELAFKIIFFPEREENRPGICAELFAHRVDRHLEVGADAVHLINETDARDVVFVRLAPNCFRLRLNPCHGVEHGDRAIEHTQRAFDFRREIHVAWRVDDVHAHFDAFVNLEDVGLRLLHPRAGRCS